MSQNYRTKAQREKAIRDYALGLSVAPYYQGYIAVEAIELGNEGLSRESVAEVITYGLFEGALPTDSLLVTAWDETSHSRDFCRAITEYVTEQVAKFVEDNVNNVEEAINILNARYEYETEHEDTAAEYTIIADDVARRVLNDSNLFSDTARFSTAIPPDGAEFDGFVSHWIDGETLYVSVYLGQTEIEAEVDLELSEDEIEEIEGATYWAHSGGYWYKTMPSNLSVVVTYTIGENGSAQW